MQRQALLLAALAAALAATAAREPTDDDTSLVPEPGVNAIIQAHYPQQWGGLCAKIKVSSTVDKCPDRPPAETVGPGPPPPPPPPESPARTCAHSTNSTLFTRLAR